MLPTFTQDPRVQLVAACDPRPEACARFEQDFNARTYASIEQLAADDKVNVIYVASPHQFHARHTAVAARHGKHVLVEKPMALSLADCDAMIAACQGAGVHLVVGHCHSFDEPYRRVRQIIDSGQYGAVRMIHALNFTDFLYRPRRPEELDTAAGGGVVFSQAAHQVDVVRLLAGSPVKRVRAATGRWDESRPTEGAYAALMWFADGAFASLTYSGYGHFDSDEWCDWTGEMGSTKRPEDYGSARRRLAGLQAGDDEARLKAAGTYGGPAYTPATHVNPPKHQHFGPVVVSCERADLRALPDAVWIYADDRRERVPLPGPPLPRYEVIDELMLCISGQSAALHDGPWARSTLEVCLAMLRSAKEGRDIDLPLA
jgi:phthalate 4,5-cis-dihydrodiol dehydrogenase